ncbi:MAG: transposase family protein [Chloroflexi bacterium]|jgi:hypothetical protein|nr:transposase family protein [Chloroflexota bacterium]
MKRKVAAQIESKRRTIADLITYFSKITDEQKPNGIRHKLMDIIVIAICGAICGAKDWGMIEHFGNIKRKWFETFLELSHGILSHSTFGKVFTRLTHRNAR